jgi:hypothetical protein
VGFFLPWIAAGPCVTCPPQTGPPVILEGRNDGVAVEDLVRRCMGSRNMIHRRHSPFGGMEFSAIRRLKEARLKAPAPTSAVSRRRMPTRSASTEASARTTTRAARTALKRATPNRNDGLRMHHRHRA